MNVLKIIDQCASLNIYEKRTMTESYGELVFFNKENEDWMRVFSGIFGPAQKPAGAKPTKEDKKITEHYGGIQGNQILFKKDFEGASIAAMFWPWQNNTHTTLKLFLIPQ